MNKKININKMVLFFILLLLVLFFSAIVFFNKPLSEDDIVKENILSSMYGKEIAVLVEKIKDGYAYGHTEEFIESKLINKGYTVGSIVKAVGESQENGILVATPI